jgi:glycosyltransferase involved in cell wall biosynthesis
MDNILNLIKILHVIHWPKSGIVKLLENMIPLFNHEMYSHYVIFFEKDEKTLSNFKKLCALGYALSYPQKKFKSLIYYRNIIKKLQPDILHTHSFQPGIFGRLFAISPYIPTVCTIHNMYPYFYKHNFKSIIKRKLEIGSIKFHRAKVIVVSKSVKEIMSKISSNLNMTIIENGIPPDIIEPKISINNKINNSGIKLISLGRLDHQKGFDYLIKAFAQAYSECKNLKLIICGDGSEKSNLFKIAEGHGVNKQIEFTGFVEDPLPKLAESDIYICSSRYEGFGLAMAEAMAVGLPLITTRIGGLAENIKDGINGIVVEPENIDDLSNAILMLASDRKKRNDIALEGQKFVNKRYNLIDTVKKYENIYREILIKG